MAINREMQGRIAELARSLCVEFGEVDESEGDCWLDAVENRAAAIGDALTAAVIAQQAAKRPLPEQESTCPECGQTGRYRGDRERELLSRRGPVTLTEPEYFCPCCRKAFFPDDQSDRR
jgi:hypothetical protein